MKLFSALCSLFSVICLTACGFEPVYGDHKGSSHPPLPGISVTAVSDIQHRRLAQEFKSSLDDLLNPDGGEPAPAYRLEAALGEMETPIGISPDGTIATYNVTLLATLKLTRIADNAVVYQDKAQRVSSYANVLNAYFSTYVSSQDAITRADNELAEDVNMRLAAFFVQHPTPKALPAGAVLQGIPVPPPMPNSPLGVTTSPSGLTTPVP